MNGELKIRFMRQWDKYFPGNELPLVCWYANSYGRFPNRNAALGRGSKPEEESFLAAGGVKWESSNDETTTPSANILSTP